MELPEIFTEKKNSYYIKESNGVIGVCNENGRIVVNLVGKDGCRIPVHDCDRGICGAAGIEINMQDDVWNYKQMALTLHKMLMNKK